MSGTRRVWVVSMPLAILLVVSVAFLMGEWTKPSGDLPHAARRAVVGGQPTPGNNSSPMRERTVTGRLVDGAGRGLAGWRISLSAADAESGRYGEIGKTEADGTFAIQSSRSGPVRFFLNLDHLLRADAHERSEFRSGEVELAEGDQAKPLTLTVDTNHTIKGRVVWSGSDRPVPGIGVSVKVEPGNAATQAVGPQCAVQLAFLWAREKTDKYGAFMIENVPNGSLEFTLEAKGIVHKSVAGKELHGEEVLDVEDLDVDTAYSLKGRLLDATTREPLRLAHGLGWVTVDATDEFGKGGAGPSLDPNDFGEAATGDGVDLDEDGRFTARNISEGATRVTITEPGYLPVEIRGVRLRPTGPTDLGDILLQLGCTLTGILIDKSQGKPLVLGRYFQIGVQEAGKTQRRYGLVRPPGDDGRFTIRGVSRDTEAVIFLDTGFSTHTVTAVPAPDGKGCIDLGRVELGTSND